MHYTLMLWQTDHVNFGGLLNLLDGELKQLRAGSSPDYGLMLDIMTYMIDYSDRLHHPKEDLAFARLKALDANAGPTILELTEQHAKLRAMGKTLVSELADVVNGSIVPIGRIEATAHAYVEGLRAHMRTEEKLILPVAARLLTDADWAAVDAAIGNFNDPLFGSQVEERFAQLRNQIYRQSQVDRAIRR
jgi:hemerythrin-like domain-containing protein